MVLEDERLCAANRTAREIRKNRSALIRDALREHLKRLRLQELEHRDCQGYESDPSQNELRAWERVGEWPRG